jgi:hypothetical protein
MAEKKPQPSQQQNVKIRYEETQALYASQFMINASDEDIIINFSSGHISDPNTGESIMPIHTRIALTPSATIRLVNTLTQVINNMQQTQQVKASEPNQEHEAGLPKISS